MTQPPPPPPLGLSRRRVPLPRKLVGLAIGTVASLATFEVVLRALHALVDPETRAGADARPAAGERRILCVGDSHTYGVYLPAKESYPARLQAYLDRAPENPWRVVNLGHPGHNTAQMRARMPGHLDALRPEIVVLWGGVNNSWSPVMQHLWDHPDGEPEGDGRGLLEHSRAYRALRMMFVEGRLMLDEPSARPRPSAADLSDRLEIETRSPGASGHDAPGRAGRLRESVCIDLRRIRATCDERGVALVLGSYWSDPPWVDEHVNPAIEEVAAEGGLPVVPLTRPMRALVAEHGHERLLTGDDHASGVGNREVARLVLETLIDAGLLEARPEWTDVPPIERYLERPTLLVASVSGRHVAMELIGAPRGLYALGAEALLRPRDGGAARALPLDGAVLPRGRIGRFGNVHLRAELPAPALGAGEELAGWRLRAEVEDRSGAVLESAPIEIAARASPSQ